MIDTDRGAGRRRMYFMRAVSEGPWGEQGTQTLVLAVKLTASTPLLGSTCHAHLYLLAVRPQRAIVPCKVEKVLALMVVLL